MRLDLSPLMLITPLCLLSLSLSQRFFWQFEFQRKSFGVCLDYGASMPAPLFYEDCKHWQEELKSWLDGFIDCMVWWGGVATGGKRRGEERRRGNSLKSVLRSTLGNLDYTTSFFWSSLTTNQLLQLLQQQGACLLTNYMLVMKILCFSRQIHKSFCLLPPHMPHFFFD